MIDNEIVFRITAVVLMVLSLAVRFYYQIKLRNERRDAPRGGQRDKFFYYMVLGSFLLVFVYAISPALDFAHVPISVALRWIGVALAVASLVLFVASHRALGRNWSGVVQLVENHVLVTHGPYRYIRHPLYTSLFAAALAFALLTANALIAFTCVGSVTLMYLARVSDEESMMLEVFGNSYEQYMHRTGRLLPKLWK